MVAALLAVYGVKDGHGSRVFVHPKVDVSGNGGVLRGMHCLLCTSLNHLTLYT